MNAAIKHLFVLALENRSFDHLFAFADMGLEQPDPAFGLNADARDPATVDPPHEFENVAAQLAGTPPMSGFGQGSCAPVSMAAFPSGSVAVLRTLAREFFLFDNWFASMPGPTWPNRFFFHAATSGGLDNSPSTVTTMESSSIDSLSFTFQNGTIYERLAAAGKKWRVYHDDLFPQVLAIKHMIDPFRLNTDQFSALRSGGTDFFKRDLHANYDVDLTFIEPDYGLAKGGFPHGNCQHPLGSLAAGESFIKYIYESIRDSPAWPDSLLVITYDEHGGFFDHVPPPDTVAPGDDGRNHGRAQNPQNCTFTRLGVRVPAVAVSPWIARGGIGSRFFPGQVFDHTAIISTARELFDLPAPLTARDSIVGSIAGVCGLSLRRTDAPQLPDPPAGVAGTAAAMAMEQAPNEPPDQTTEGFARIALSVDLAIAEAEKTPPVAASRPFLSPGAAVELATAPAAEMLPQIRSLGTRRAQLTDYMEAVAARRRAAPPLRRTS